MRWTKRTQAIYRMGQAVERATGAAVFTDTHRKQSEALKALSDLTEEEALAVIALIRLTTQGE